MILLRKLKQLKAIHWFFMGIWLTVVISNVLVIYPVYFFNLQDYLVYGNFTYPLAYLLTDLCTRWLGGVEARRMITQSSLLAFPVVVIIVGVQESNWTSGIYIASASLFCFFIAQQLDIYLFSRLQVVMPFVFSSLISTLIANIPDSLMFNYLVFYPRGLDWTGYFIGDIITKYLVIVGYATLFTSYYRYVLKRTSLLRS